ncbi:MULTISPECIES: rod-binding protein [Pseudovibrio]|uniref:rod-binding protein n=1 Tax=Stappiaceae TaxID=2821832 RepID=UPI0023653C4F|nr:MULTISPECIES: rod-binding protein [Pseudovibrio]MDD7910432.1 rod-binding protein [Pseudovibrio exalbescens]MDX5594147.1 rod-binding protein [Pseudovibrio sp. SPO723]
MSLINTVAANPAGAYSSAPAGTTQEDAIRKKAQDFEAVYLNQLMQTMFNGVESGGTFGNGPGADAWKSMMINEYAASMAANGGIGLADSITKQLLELQEI